MSPADLAAKCAAFLNDATELGLPVEHCTVLLVLPKGWRPPPRFPRGRTAQWKEGGGRVACFSAMDVLAWLAAHDLVKIRTKVRHA